MNNMVWSKIKENKTIVLIIAFAFFLRSYKLYQNLFFGWEQGRDFLKYGEILAGDIILVGPKTDIAGVFHGALSYYLFLPFYILFQGSPYFMSLALILLNVGAVYFLFEIARMLFDKRTAYLASLLYAVSYSSVIYNRWLLHENPVPAFTILGIYSLIQSIKSSKYLFVFAIVWGIALHLAIQMSVILLVMFFIFYLLKRPRYSREVVITSLAILTFFLSPFVIFDLKNSGVTRNAIVNYLQEEKEEVAPLSTLDEFKNELTDNIYPPERSVALALFSISNIYLLFVKSKKRVNIYFVLSLVLAMPVIYIIFTFRPLRHFYIYIPPLIALLMAVFISQLYKLNKALAVFVLLLIMFGNLKIIFEKLPDSESNFIHHAQRTYLSDELALIDYVYSEANGEDFTYNYYTVPYWQPHAWEYLFNYYGRKKYGYAPAVNTRTDVFYVVYEPDETQPLYQENWLKDLDKESELLDKYMSGKLTAEKRKLYEEN